MTVKVKEYELEDYRNGIEIEIDGKVEFDFRDGEPEDANLSRNFSDCYKIPHMLYRAWYAGCNGSKFCNVHGIPIDERNMHLLME